MSGRELGTVVECSAHNTVVAIEPKTCDGCSCSVKEKKPALINASPLPGIKKGDQVWLETSSTDLLKAGFILGILPTTGFFIGIAITAFCIDNPPQYMYFVGGLIGIAAVLMGVKFFSRGKVAKPSIVAIHNDAEK